MSAHTETCNRCGGAFAPATDGVVALLRCADCGREVPASALHPSPGQRTAGTVKHVTDALHFTVRYEDGEDDWILAFIDQVPGAMSQGRTRDEARENVIDALRLMLSPDDALDADPTRDSVDLQLAS